MSGDVVSIISKVSDIIGPTLLRQCGYVVFCKSYISDLKDEIKKLKNASTRLRHKVEAESLRGIIEDDVWTWLNKADELIDSGNLILQENNLSCFGFISNPKARYGLGRRAKKCLPTLKEHLNEGKFDQVSFQPVAEPILEVKVRSATSSSTVRYVELKSRALVLKKIVVALDEHMKIGVHGMGGVGKTTLLKEVEKIAKESGKFDDVVSVFVSQAPDIEGIKGKIRNKLKRLESSGDDASKKTLLILLDDLWEKFNSIGELENGTKVKVKWVMTSRQQALLAKEMSCHPTFSLGDLDEEEGWHLFRELLMSSNNVEDLKKNPTTVELLKKCAGLPVSIEALATIWKNKGLSPTDLVSVEELNLGKDDGSVSLELSYNYLGDKDGKDEAKLLFRTIGLLGTPTVPILTLLKYTVGLGSIDNNTNDKIMDRARREVTRSVCTLQDSSLLLESDDSNHVKIHDLVRDVAVRIACKDDHALIFNPKDGVKGWSWAKMKDSTAVSLPYSALPMLYKGWKCPNAKIFIMRVASEQGDHVALPDSFFKGSVKLRIIDLRNARLSSLPSSIQSDLHNLTTLCLDYCYLEDVAAIGKLKSLQVLSFVGSEIAELPEEIGGLTNLRMLDLSKCLKLESIKPGVLGRLTRLEELYLKESFDRWEMEGDGQQQSNSSLAELNNMVHLSTLEIHVPDDSKLPPSLPLEDLVQYKVLMGEWDWSGEYKESRTLKLTVKWDNIMTEEWLQSALQKVQDFHLEGLNGTKESFQEVCWEGFKELHHLHLQNSSSIKSIVWSMKCLSCETFTTLESMHLENLESLEKICSGPASFSKLKVVRVQNCHKLRSLFNISFVKSFPEIEEIDVSDCNLVRAILIAEKMDDDGYGGTNEDNKKVITCFSDNLFCCPIKRSSGVSKTQSDAEKGSCEDYQLKLDKLHSLTLRNLPELTTFFTKEAPSSESTDIPLPAFLNDQQVLLYNSESQKLFSRSKFKEISSSSHLALTLRRVVVENCNKIVNFIDSKMLLTLQNLESLTIGRCESLENIFDLEGIDAKSGNVEILPKLSELKLTGLPKLVHIWKKNFKQIKGCQNLRIMEIHQCGSLSYLCGSSMCKGMGNLTEINIVQCDVMETVFLEEDGPTKDVSTAIRLTSLKIIEISECPNLKVFLSSHVDSCINKGMSCWCFGKKDSIFGDTSISFFNNKVSLPNLESLFLSSSGKFETLWGFDLPTDRSYYNLKVVSVDSCDTLSVVFPATLIERLQKLKQLLVYSCAKLRTVIDLDVYWKDEKRPKELMLSQLQKLRLIDLENMTHVMEPGDSEILVAFPKMKEIKVHGCSKLMYLMPTSTAITTLWKLESLDISYCEQMHEVIHGEVSNYYKRNVINFPQLTSLMMGSLESLTHFSSESYLFDFTRLRHVNICGCRKMETLVKPASSDHDLGSQAATSVQPLFNNKVDMPNLENLEIIGIEVEELWCSEPLTTSFCKLKSLVVNVCPRIRKIIPSLIVKRLQNLKSIQLYECELLDDVFAVPSVHDSRVLEGCITEENKQSPETIILPKLTSLKVPKNIKLNSLKLGSYNLELPSLKELYLEEIAGDTAKAILEKVDMPNLEKLEISLIEVEELWCSEPLTTSFCKLKFLGVYSCPRIRKIIPSFIVKRLQNLKFIHIYECELLDDVFAVPSVHDSRVLEGCITEENKQSAETIILPKLTFLQVGKNIKLNGLKLGSYNLELPSLKELYLQETAGDTANAILEKVYLPNLEEMEVHYIDNTMGLWHNEPYVGSFCKLRYLQVAYVGQLTIIIPSFMLKRMQNLEKLKVQNCDKLLTVAELGVLIDAEESESKLPQFPFEHLTSIHVESCECLKSLFIISEQPYEIGDTSECRREIVLRHLTDLRLKWLPNFSHLFHVQGQYSLQLSSLKEFFLTFSGAKEAVTEKVIFPKDLKIHENERDSTFFGSTTTVVMDIIKALRQTKKNRQIIGVHGAIESFSITDFERIVKEEEKMFDAVVNCCCINYFSAFNVQEQFGYVLGIVYRDEGDQGRAQRLRKTLLSNKEKRMLYITTLTTDESKAAGVPFEELDPKFFKQIMMSLGKEKLMEMGAQPVIEIGVVNGSIFITELSKMAFSQQQLQQQEELQVDTNTDTEISSFVGSSTDVMNRISKALLNSNHQIIGLFGKEGIKYYHRLFIELVRLARDEVNRFDDIVDLDGNNIHDIYDEQLGDSNDTIAGFQERAQHLRERLVNNKDKRLLLIILRDLDHGWDLGIPQEELNPKLLKIIVFSKSREVLHKMGAQQVIDIPRITSYNNLLYHRILDAYVETSDFSKLAKECGCEDLAKVLAKKLKGQGLRAWGNAYHRLKESPFEYEARREVILNLTFG